ncbi:RcpC/CpaB family pilus assembly protein [Streptomyces sp. NBC_00984]|uniref:RcpC/CpaB family pilus assembly protein n=1 Tax=Streptomyces sp. NBC_00984 TaxID=2903700 RepID=UPI00386BCC2C|nr:RcpC/CpaB family pilus assembly protein [Streptomyces sp. NBC_00984]
MFPSSVSFTSSVSSAPRASSVSPSASSASSALPSPSPAPPPCGVPVFEPLRVRGGGGRRLRRALWRQRRALAAGLALTAAALAATGLGGGGAGTGGEAAYGAGAGGEAGAAPAQARRPARLVSAPVRIADAGAVRLLRPGDHVDVIAAGEAGAGTVAGTSARVLAKGARVAEVPQAPVGGSVEDGALIVLSVPRDTATALAGAGISSQLAVALC